MNRKQKAQLRDERINFYARWERKLKIDMRTLREKLIKLGVSDVFVNNLEAEYKQMGDNNKPGLSQEQYKDHCERCRRLAWQILHKLDQV